jgi:hypothetical protein
MRTVGRSSEHRDVRSRSPLHDQQHRHRDADEQTPLSAMSNTLTATMPSTTAISGAP